MAKYKILNKLETMINILGGEESMEAVARGEIKVDLNPVHQRLIEITKRYEDELLSAGAVIVGDRHFGVRDIIFPVECIGSEQETFSKMECAIVQKGFSVLVHHAKNYPLGSLEETEILQYVSLRNTLEYFKENGEKLPNFWIVDLHDCDYLSGRDFFCFMARYIGVFAKDWFGKEKSLFPIAFGTRPGWSDIRCILAPSEKIKSKRSVVKYTSGICCEEYGPWLTV
jgi:hypothetical protein